VDLTVATELGGLDVFGDRRRGHGGLTGFGGYTCVFSWHYCCFYCHNRESSWWSERQSEQFGSVDIGSVDRCMLVAQNLDPPTFPQCSRLPTNLAAAGRFHFGGFEALAYGVMGAADVDAQPAELLLHLQDFKLASAFLLEFLNQGFQAPG
jgi:hypothetical protein